MERATKEITTPNGHKLVLKEYITAREFLPIAKSAPEKPTNAENIERGLSMIDLAVVSVDGVTEKVSEIIQDLPVEDFTFITQEVAKLTDFRKTKSSTGTSSSS
jgi:hypothetical protein